jgi:hypothetical protein
MVGAIARDVQFIERELEETIRENIDLRAKVASQEQMLAIQNEAIAKLQSERDRFMRSASEVSMLCENVSDMLAKGLRRFLMNEATRDPNDEATPLFIRRAMEQQFAQGRDRVDEPEPQDRQELGGTSTAAEFLALHGEALNAAETQVLRPPPGVGTARVLPSPRFS